MSVDKCLVTKTLLFFLQVMTILNISAQYIINNIEKDCWAPCGNKQGSCSWCGSKGLCCTQRPGWTDRSNGCDGTIGGITRHECLLPRK